jgi:hypothetical protein
MLKSHVLTDFRVIGAFEMVSNVVYITSRTPIGFPIYE